MREEQRGVRRLPRMAAGCNTFLAGLVFGALACSAPPPPAAEVPVAHRAHGAQPAPAELQCGLVQRAPRTWVGFAEGMTADDMAPAGIAAAAAVRAVDVAVCGLVQRGQRVPVLEPHRPQLKAAGELAVTKIWWDDLAMSRARLELQGASAPAGWLASLVRTGERWNVATFRARPQE